MIVRHLASVDGTDRDVAGPTWRSRRLLVGADGVDFSINDTQISAGTTTVMEYRNHVEAVYCVAGRGSVRALPDGDVHPIAPGTLYVLDAHDRHELICTEDLRFVCVFRPALRGDETHDASGSYPPSIDSETPSAPVDPYASRSAVASTTARLDPVLHAGSGAEGPLSRAQLEEFGLRGYVVLRGRFSIDEARSIRREIARLEASLPASDERLVREPESDCIRSLFAFHTLGGPLAELACEGRIVHPAAQILGSDVYIHQSRINHKMGFDGREFAWHSDFETWHAEDGMPRMRALSAMIMLSPNDGTNGSLLVIPGSHRTFVGCVGEAPADNHLTSLRRQVYGVPNRDDIARLAGDLGVVQVEGDAGDVLLFDCNLLHASPGNLSPSPRTNAFVVFDSVQNGPRRRQAGRSARPPHVAVPEVGQAVVATTVAL